MGGKDYKEKILNWMEQRIKTSDEFFFPLKKLRKELSDGLTIRVPPAERIEQWLAEDGRFDLLEMPEGFGGYSAAEKVKMEQLGFFDGVRVGLKAKHPTPRQVAEKLSEHAGKLIRSLQKAYETRVREGEGAAEFEDQLIGLLRRAQKLQKEIPEIAKVLEGQEKGGNGP